MIITNIETVPGKSIVEHYGLVSGSTVRAKHIGRDIMAGLKNIVGGELKGYTELLNGCWLKHVKWERTPSSMYDSPHLQSLRALPNSTSTEPLSG
jgi:hypothetical protein